jgi:hypothetical protein
MCCVLMMLTAGEESEAVTHAVREEVLEKVCFC